MLFSAQAPEKKAAPGLILADVLDAQRMVGPSKARRTDVGGAFSDQSSLVRLNAILVDSRPST